MSETIELIHIGTKEIVRVDFCYATPTRIGIKWPGIAIYEVSLKDGVMICRGRAWKCRDLEAVKQLARVRRGDAFGSIGKRRKHG